MPQSAESRGAASGDGGGLAVLAESLYLVNLLLAPVLAFLVLAVLYLRTRRHAPPLAAAHLGQTFAASLWAGVLLVVVNALILLAGGYQGVVAWTLMILYFILCHATLVLLGVLGLVKAMAGQCWRYPLIGPRLPEGCAEAAPHA